MAKNNTNLNYAREFVSRLKNVCYNHTIIQVINALAQNTNYEKQTYYGGIIELRRQTHLSHAAVKSAMRKLFIDGVIRRELPQSDLYLKGQRQNYKLILPPAGLITCNEWQGHNQTQHHLDSWGEFVVRHATLEREASRLICFQEARNPLPRRDFIPGVEEQGDSFYW